MENEQKDHAQPEAVGVSTQNLNGDFTRKNPQPNAQQEKTRDVTGEPSAIDDVQDDVEDVKAIEGSYQNAENAIDAEEVDETEELPDETYDEDVLDEDTSNDHLG